MVDNSSQTAFIRPEGFWRILGLRAEETVVHLGCGAGFYLIPAARIVGSKGMVIGLDIRSDMLAEAESRARLAEVGKIIRTVRANLEEPGASTLPDGLADWVLVANILHQADATKILTEARRLVKPMGSVVVVEWDTAASPLGPPAQRRIPENAVREVAAALGLLVKRSFRPSPYHYGLVLGTNEL
jgi:ubiquinone/menaquinone biosynthesis C-methylase UbiE